MRRFMDQLNDYPFSITLLAGGQSRRMGRDKSQLIFGGESLIARAVRRLRGLSDDVIVVTNAPDQLADLDARLIGDALPGGGALSGIHAGLLAARHEFTFVAACDMPFLNLALVRHMAGLAPGHAVVVPRWQGEFEPLHAFYSCACLALVERLLRQGGASIFDMYSALSARYLEPDEITRFDPEGLSFFNVNTPEDWARAQRIFETLQG